MLTRIRNRHLFLSDILLLCVASYASFVLRLEDYHLTIYWLGFILFTALALLLTPILLHVSKAYSHYWRYASIHEFVQIGSIITLAALLASSVILGIFWIFQGSIIIPRSMPFIFLLLALPAITGPRLLLRISSLTLRSRRVPSTKRVLVMEQGSAGAAIVREVREHPNLPIHIVGIVDDDPTKLHTRIHGVPVIGECKDLLALAQAHNIDQIIIAMPEAPGRTIREIVRMCEQAGVTTKIIPAMHELLGNRITVNQLRDVRIEDLLRRAPVQSDDAGVEALLRGKRVLITGGGGSIGRELCRQVLNCRPSDLIILGHGENSIFEIYNELSWRMAAEPDLACRLHPVIADVRFPDRIDAVFATFRPEIVFHAAAHKHVPLMEQHPIEAINTNVLGTRTIVRAAQRYDVEQLVMISTDKAVSPTSIMGASKRVAELLVYDAAQASGKAFASVRFGNVLGSRGSVVLTFQKQIAAGGPITITHPDIRRFFMTIPEAVHLVLQAAVLERGGEVFVLDMGEPVKIVDLANDLVKLSGLEPGRDIEIAFTGLRPGEKLYEELFLPGEAYEPTCHKKIFVARNATALLPPHLHRWIDALDIAAARNDSEAIVWTLQQLVHEHSLYPEISLDAQEQLLEHQIGV